MSTIVDAKGLSCPQPVIKTLQQISKMKTGQMEILVDTDTAKENVRRATESKGWTVVDIVPEEEGYRITIGKDS